MQSPNAPFPSDLSANQASDISPSNFFQWPDETLPLFPDDLWNWDPKDEYTQDSHANPNTIHPVLGLPSANRSYNPFEPPGLFPQVIPTVPVNESRPGESSVFTYTQDRFLPVSPPQGLPFDNPSHNPFEPPPGIFHQAPLVPLGLPVDEGRLGEYTQEQLNLPLNTFISMPPLLGLPSHNHLYNPFEPAVFHQAPQTPPVFIGNEIRLGGESFVPSTALVVNPTRKRLNEDERRALLEQDAYILSFDAKTVICSGCRKKIKLDGRDHARFYTTNWYNHKARCLGVEAGMVRHDLFASQRIWD
jgi:hypothetical protein